MNRRKKHAQLSEFWRRFRKNKAAVLGLVLLVLIIGMAVFADLIVPYSKCIEQVGADRLQGPSLKHFFGTDELGRDLFARIVHGSRYSLLIGLATSLMALVVGAIIGASNQLIVCPNHHSIIHDTNPVFDRRRLLYICCYGK